MKKPAGHWSKSYRHIELTLPRNASPGTRPLPPKPAEMTWRDYLVLLLHIAAELEHALMVEYLYAGYSLGGERVPAKHENTVRRWRDIILSVAREEMGHLLTVQNVLCLFGGPVSFNRDDFPWDSPFYPFPFKLEPLSLDSLACYVYAEMPPYAEILHQVKQRSGKMSKSAAAKLQATFEAEVNAVRDAVVRRIHGRQSHPVGEIYERIIELVGNEKLIPDTEFRTESFPFQASWDDWGRGYQAPPAQPDGSTPKGAAHTSHIIIARMGTRTEALEGLKAIAGQGEAPQFSTPKEQREDPDHDDSSQTTAGLSHFERFARIFVELSAVKTWKPARRVPVNPTTMKRQFCRYSETPITNVASRIWASLFNLRYRILLTYLSHTYRLARGSDPASSDLRAAVMHRIYGEMYNIKAIAGILVRMPLGNPKKPERAGPPFQMPYSLDLPLIETDRWRLHQDNLRSSQDLCAVLLEPQYIAQAPSGGLEYIKSLQNLDAQAQKWLGKVLESLQQSGRTSP